MINIYYKNKNDESIKVIPETKRGSWIYVQDPDERELKFLSNNINLDKDLLKDALDPYEVPRVEIENNLIYIFLRFPVQKGNDILTVPILIISTENHLITISKEKMHGLDNLVSNKNLCTTQKTKLLIHLFLTINGGFQKLINDINRVIRNKTSNLEKIGNKDIVELIKMEKVLNEFMSALVPTGITVEKIHSGKFVRLYEEDKDLVEDLYLSLNQLIDICKSNLKYIVNIRDGYDVIISNNLNKTMKILTAMTVVLTIPTIISSFFGMNVQVPLGTNQFAFPIIMAGTIVLSFFILIILIKKNMF